MRIWLAVFAVAVATAGCVASRDPAAPCPAFAVGFAEPATSVAPAQAPLLAMTANDHPFVLTWSCNADDPCTLVHNALPELQPGTNVLITATGSHVVGTDSSGNLLAFPIEGVHVGPATRLDAGPPPVTLVAALRGGDWLLVRDREERLRRVHPDPQVMQRAGDLRVAPNVPSLKVIALGEQAIVGRVALGHGREELHVVSLEHDGTLPLGRGSSFDHVLLTPRDERVVATSGEETYVFDATTGRLVDRFTGHIASGRRAHEEVPGLRAISPDGGLLAYVTPSGSVALRDLELGGACLVRSSTAGRHSVAGFSAAGSLFFEADARGPVLAWNPESREQDELSPLDAGIRLAAVPGSDEGKPWAIGVRDGRYFIVQPNRPPLSLDLDEAVFVPRSAAAMWAVHSDERRGDGWRRLRLLQVDPLEDARYRVLEPRVGGKTFSMRIGGRVCMSMGAPGSWGERCGHAQDEAFFLTLPVPASELPD